MCTFPFRVLVGFCRLVRRLRTLGSTGSHRSGMPRAHTSACGLYSNVLYCTVQVQYSTVLYSTVLAAAQSNAYSVLFCSKAWSLFMRSSLL